MELKADRDIFTFKKLADCLYIVTNYQQAEEAIKKMASEASIVNNAVNQLLLGEIDPDSFLDIFDECTTFDMDQYLDEIEMNLSEIL